MQNALIASDFARIIAENEVMDVGIELIIAGSGLINGKHVGISAENEHINGDYVVINPKNEHICCEYDGRIHGCDRKNTVSRYENLQKSL